MPHLWTNYFIFLCETFTIVIALLLVVLGLVAIFSKDKKTPGTLTITKLNDQLQHITEQLQTVILDKKTRKQMKKQEKKAEKNKAKNTEQKKRIFILNFTGDLHASQVTALREEITAVLQVANEQDEVMINLESPGGVVQSYGLAASQLARIKAQNIRLTVCIDRIAASGGYLMACVADEIIAAPFAIVGSIGVVAQLPNFHRLLKKHNIDFEQITAGKYKRTLTLFGENTDQSREKMKEDLEEIHQAFKNHINTYRQGLNFDQVATGEFWLASDAQGLHLVDRLQTSDDYLMYAAKHFDLFEIRYVAKKSMLQKIQGGVNTLLANNFNWHS